jgi:Porin subfamily
MQMRFPKAVLLNSCCALFLTSGAQGADLPTRKAQPADFVKTCNVGGMAGFILPGSDTCFKISGYISAQVGGGNLQRQYNWVYGGGTSGNPVGKAYVTNGMPVDQRAALGWTNRANLSFDLRQDTPYGVLRGYTDVNIDNGSGYDTTGVGAYIERAYVQWAGLTVGKANSFFNFGGGYGWLGTFSPGQTGYNQPDEFAYTATFGRGWSATIAAQSSGPNGPSYLSSAYTNSGNGAASVGWAASGSGTNMSGNYNWLGMQAPDIVAVLRVDQEWGSAQLSGVAHQVRVQDAMGFTEDKWGGGVLVGARVNTPSLGAGDALTVDAVWTRNAFFLSGIPGGMWGENGQVNGNGLPMYSGDTWSNGNGAWATPSAWSAAVNFEHHFSPVFSLDPEFSYAQLHWGGLNAGSGIPTNAYSWIFGGVAHWDPVAHLDVTFEAHYETTHQSTPVAYNTTAAAPASFPHDASGVGTRFYITRDF